MKISAKRYRQMQAWRHRNVMQAREIRRAHYERRREWYCWKERLKVLLMKIVRAEEARGRFE